jgi:NADH-quinone oxidoreductase subunit M
LSVREWCAAAPLVAAAILMGVLPTLFLRPMEPSVTRVVQRVTQSQRVNVRALPATRGARVRADQAASAATAAAASEVGLR